MFAGNIQGINIEKILRITHLLFVDDVVIFGKGVVEEWVVYKELLELFCNASRMEVSESKSVFLEYGMDTNEKE